MDEQLRALWSGDTRKPCACRRCAPNLYPSESHGPLQGEGHATLRFGRRPEHLYTSIILDGEVSLFCVEAFADATGDGWIIEDMPPDGQRDLCTHLCAATGHLEYCEHVRYGRVAIQRDLLEGSLP